MYRKETSQGHIFQTASEKLEKMVLFCSQVNDISGIIFSLKYIVIKPLHYSPGGYMIFYIYIGLADFFGFKILQFDNFFGGEGVGVGESD